MKIRHFYSVALQQKWRNHENPLLNSPLAFPNAFNSSLNFSSSSSIDSQKRTISEAGDQSPSVVSILDRHIQSGKVVKPSKSSKPPMPFGSITQRMLKNTDPRLSVVSVLENWVEKGLDVDRSELHNLTKKLRQQSRFFHALQISEWMVDRWGFDLPAKHFAVHLDLISKVHGLEKAEEFFSRIPDGSKDYQVFVVLLICFAHAKHLEKAEALMQKMRDMEVIKTAYAYNIMLNLYSKMGIYKKLDDLLQEMEKKGIKHDIFTLEIRLHAYAASGDIEGMEKFLEKIKLDPEIGMSFRAFTFSAYGYIKAGLFDKALLSLKKSEQLAQRNFKRYEKLLPLYAAVGSRADVYQVWNLYKKSPTYYKTGYVSMINALVKLDDMDGAEKIYEEWDFSKMKFDIRIPNAMIRGYSKDGFLEKAEEHFDKIIERGERPNVDSFDGLVTRYLLDGQMLEAVDTMKKAMSLSKPGQNPSLHNLAGCLKYLEGQGDKKEAEEFWKMIVEHCQLSRDERDRLSCLVDDESLDVKPVVLRMEVDRFCVEPPTALEFSGK